MLISIVVPTYNEQENIQPLCDEITRLFRDELSRFDYEIIVIDNASSDGTRDIIRKLCDGNKRIKAIFNAKNFGPINSPYYGLCQVAGDCAILVAADFQDPIEMIPQFIREWEKGHCVVCGVKTASRENPFVYFLRSLYYKLIKRMSPVEQIEHFTGFGLYDHSFIDILRRLKDPSPFLRGIVAEFGSNCRFLSYEQQKRRAGTSSYNLYGYYDVAMLSFTTYTKIGLRVATIGGFIFSLVSLTIAFIYLLLKLFFWDRFPAGMAPAVLGVFVLGSIQLFFIGLLGEYILTINTRLMDRPLVIEETRINFDEPDR